MRPGSEVDRLRAEAVDTALGLALANSDADAIAASIKRIENLDKLAAQAGISSRRDLIDGAIILLALGGFLSVLVSWKPRPEAFLHAVSTHVELESSALSMTRQATYENARIVVTEGAFRHPPAASVFPKATLSGLSKGEGAVVLLVGRRGACDYLRVEVGEIQGVVWRTDSQPPEPSEWVLQARPGRPASLQICGTRRSGLELVGFTSGVKLSESVSTIDSTNEVVPVLKSGIAVLSGQRVTLGSFDIVSVVHGADDAQRDHSRLRVSMEEEGVEITVTGHPGEVRIGPPGSSINRAPSAVERLTTNSPWAIVLASMAGIFGSIWGVRKLLRGM